MHFPITRTFLIYHTVIPTSETFFKEVTYAVIYIHYYLCTLHILNGTFYINIHFTLHLFIHMY